MTTDYRGEDFFLSYTYFASDTSPATGQRMRACKAPSAVHHARPHDLIALSLGGYCTAAAAGGSLGLRVDEHLLGRDRSVRVVVHQLRGRKRKDEKSIRREERLHKQLSGRRERGGAWKVGAGRARTLLPPRSTGS